MADIFVEGHKRANDLPELTRKKARELTGVKL